MYLVLHLPILWWDHLWTTGPTQNSAHEPTWGLREVISLVQPQLEPLSLLSPLDG